VLDFSLWDVVVANFGQHCAAGAEHWTLGEYARHVEAYWDALAQRLRAQDRASPSAPETRSRQQLPCRVPHCSIAGLNPGLCAQDADPSSTTRTRVVWQATHAMVLARDSLIASVPRPRRGPFRLRSFRAGAALATHDVSATEGLRRGAAPRSTGAPTRASRCSSSTRAARSQQRRPSSAQTG
jgi:hypothetical protein